MSVIVFTYSAVDQSGQPIKGTVEASDKEDALKKIDSLRQLGFSDIVIENANIVEQKAGESEKTVTKGTEKKGIPLFAKICHALAVLWTLFCLFSFFSGLAAISNKDKPTSPEAIMSECKKIWGNSYTMIETCVKSKEEAAKNSQSQTVGTVEAVAISVGFFFWMMIWFFPTVGLEVIAIAVTVGARKK